MQFYLIILCSFINSLTVIPTTITSQNVIGSQTTIVQTCSQASSVPPFHPILSDSTTSVTSTPTPFFVEGILIWKKYQRIREHGQKMGMSQKINVCVCVSHATVQISFLKILASP